MSVLVQLELIEEPIYKVTWKAYEEEYETDNRTFGKRFIGFTDKIKIRTNTRIDDNDRSKIIRKVY